MRNPTNARAFIRLQPTKNNIGGIVEEHTRFWRKYDDEQEAKRKAQQAREAETKRKLDKQAFDLYSGLKPEENKGYFNNQIIQYADSNRKKWKDLVYKATFNGDIDARLQLEEEKNKLDNLVKLNKVYGQKQSELLKQKSEGTFNPELDTPVEDFHKSLAQGKYKINSNGTVSVYDPEGKQVETLSSSEMLSNPYLTWSYSKNANFDKNGLAIAQKILDTKDGSKQITDPAEIRRRGIANAKAVLDSDSIEQRTFYKIYNKERGITPTKSYSELNDAEQTAVASLYHDKYTEPKIREIINTADNRLEEEKIKTERARRANINARTANINSQREDNIPETISLKRTENGELVRPAFAGASFSGSLPKDVKHGSTTSSKSVAYTGFNILENGGVELTGFELSDNIDEETGDRIKSNVPVRTTDIDIVNEVLKRVPNGKGKKTTFKNAKEFFDLATEKAGSEKGANSDRFLRGEKETPQERIARLRRENGLK